MTHKERVAILRELSPYQMERIKAMAFRFLTLDNELANTHPCGYSKCGDKNAILIKKGFFRKKQRYQCKSCGKKFTYDIMQVTLLFYWLNGIVNPYLNAVAIFVGAMVVSLLISTILMKLK